MAFNYESLPLKTWPLGRKPRVSGETSILRHSQQQFGDIFEISGTYSERVESMWERFARLFWKCKTFFVISAFYIHISGSVTSTALSEFFPRAC